MKVVARQIGDESDDQYHGGAAAGITIANGAATILSRVIASQLFGIPRTDFVTYAAAAALLVVIAIISSYLPARRAARVEPMSALRYE